MEEGDDFSQSGGTRIINGFTIHMEPLELTQWTKRGRVPIWPFDGMELYEVCYVTDALRFQSAYNSAAHIHRKTDKRFELRRVPVGLRVQRVQ